MPRRLAVTTAVYDEVLRGPDDEGRRTLAAGGIEVIEAPLPGPELLSLRLGDGETSVLALALGSPGATALLDDAAARRSASRLAIPVMGTLGVLVLAARRGIVGDGDQAVQAVRAARMHVADELARDIARLAHR